MESVNGLVTDNGLVTACTSCGYLFSVPTNYEGGSLVCRWCDAVVYPPLWEVFVDDGDVNQNDSQKQ